MLRYEQIVDPNRGRYDASSGCYIGIIYKYRLKIQRPKSKRKSDLNDLMEDTYIAISKLSPRDCFEAERKNIATKVGCSDPNILRLVGYEILNPSLIKKYGK
jgi:hypothetical protein